MCLIFPSLCHVDFYGVKSIVFNLIQSDSLHFHTAIQFSSNNKIISSFDACVTGTMFSALPDYLALGATVLTQ